MMPAAADGDETSTRFRYMGLALLCVAVPVLRDLLIRQRLSSGAVIAAVANAGVLVVCLSTMRAAGLSALEVGIRSITRRSLLLGLVAGTLLVAPVWRLPLLTAPGASWLFVAVVVEEVAFRGVLFAILRRVGGLPLATLGSTAAFTMAHVGSAPWPALALVGLAGLLLGLLRAMRGDLWAPGIAHFLLDLVSRA
ncbi:MAG: CPBP family glutamic-type intramembrane protease [Candidatus Dormibacteraeota bacterium]|nr:CPBP family glutamic-type intramembrane protease [Candidatus Dormibacteraeota bacterium]